MAPIFATAGRNVKSAQRSVKAGDEERRLSSGIDTGTGKIIWRQRNFVIDDAAARVDSPRGLGK
jgi:hypothetical protein